MKQITTLLLSFFSVTAAYEAPPVNDSITKAISVTAPYQFITTPDVSTATAASIDPLNQGVSLGKTIWYRLSKGPEGGPQNRHVTVNSLGGAGTAGIYVPNDVGNVAGSLIQIGSLSPIAAGQIVVLIAQSLWASTYLMLAGTGRREVTCQLDSGYDFPVTARDQGSASPDTEHVFNHSATESADKPALATAVSNTIWLNGHPTSQAVLFWIPIFSSWGATWATLAAIGPRMTPCWQLIHAGQEALRCSIKTMTPAGKRTACSVLVRFQALPVTFSSAPKQANHLSTSLRVTTLPRPLAESPLQAPCQMMSQRQPPRGRSLGAASMPQAWLQVLPSSTSLVAQRLRGWIIATCPRP